ncbi:MULTISPECIES: hypothetical protein [Sulfitobacter]|uniref:Apea-like HEPN domain-containing protein n=1 Tax=Sulfitobacter profundi TaxID=2679961 RepID=A0ABW1Z0G4_9RHOB|nr:hypothetical protein [Sulfitobacter indolifex]
MAEALAIRNSLMHGYFPRNARNLINPDGRRAMKRELDEAAEVLWQATLKVAPFVGQEAEQLLQMLVHAQFSE